MAISRETLRLLDGMRISMLAPVDRADAALIRAWGVAWNELAAEWDAALGDLVTSSTGGQWPSRAKVRRAKRIQTALAQTREALLDLSSQLPVTVTQALPAMTQDAADWSRRLAASQYPPQAGTAAQVAASFDQVTPAALDAIVRRTTERVTALSQPLTAQAEQAMRSTLVRGIALGDNPNAAVTTTPQSGQGSGGCSMATSPTRSAQQISARPAAR